MPVWDVIANRGTLTDRSGTIATGGQSQLVAPAFAYRSYLFVQNPSSAAESLFVNFSFPANMGTGSYELLPGASIEMKLLGFVSIEAVNVVAATTGHAFTYKEF